jgi:hypothetical protein
MNGAERLERKFHKTPFFKKYCNLYVLGTHYERGDRYWEGGWSLVVGSKLDDFRSDNNNNKTLYLGANFKKAVEYIDNLTEEELRKKL